MKMSFFSNNIVLFLYIITIIYFVMLGCYMLAQRGSLISTRGEQMTKLRMTRSVGVFMLIWALDYLIYLPPMLGSSDVWNSEYDVSFLITMMLETPALYVVMHAIEQKRVNNMRWSTTLAAPFFILTVWYIVVPFDLCGRLPVHIAAVLNVLCIAYLLIKYEKEYRAYVHRIKSEYSEISGREIIWSWSCFAGFALQSIVFLLYEYNWVPMMEFAYWALSIANAAYLCYCTCRQKPLDHDVVEDVTEEDESSHVSKKENHDEKAFYAVIEQKLESLCEEKLLFLEADLTRETLCRRISVSSTYLKMYFSSRGLSFYQYINTLRVEYAVKLMEENPDMPIREVCELSGFRSQTTFRKMFMEVMGCLPSEIKSKKENHAQ